MPPEGCSQLSLLDASIAAPRASVPAPTERAVDQLLPRLAEMDVDDAVQDKVEREVGSLENIRGDDSRVD